MRFAFVHVEKANHKISPLCRVLGVSRQGYHAWVNRGPSLRSQSDAKLAEDVERIHQEAHGTYGSPRIHAALRREGIRVSKRRVERAMRKKSLKANRRKRFRVTTTRNEADRVAPNDLNRRFTVESQPGLGDRHYVYPNRLWLGLFGGDSGPVLSASRGLGCRKYSLDPVGAQRTRDGPSPSSA